MRVAGLLLAAGAGRRFGLPKALVPGWLPNAAAALAEGGCGPVVVVLGAGADEVRERVDLAGLQIVDNPSWATGLGSSLRAGLGALATDPVPVAALIVLVDVPGLTSAAVRRLAALASADALAVATYGGRPGHPVLLGRAHWAPAADLAVGDRGARDYLRANSPELVPCDDIADGADVDTPSCGSQST